MAGSDPLTDAPELPVRTVHFRRAAKDERPRWFVPTHEDDPRASLMGIFDAKGRPVAEFYEDVLASLLDGRGRGPDGYELTPTADVRKGWLKDGRRLTRDEERAMVAELRERSAQTIRPADILAFWEAEATRRRKARVT